MRRMTDGSRRRPYWVKAYYGPGGRAGGKGRVGEREGDLAIAVEYSDAHGRDVEAGILRARDDVGAVVTGYSGEVS